MPEPLTPVAGAPRQADSAGCRPRQQRIARGWNSAPLPVTAGGRLTAEPEPVSFWAPMADGVCSPIEGEDYSAVPTTRDPGLLRRQARARATGQRRRPREEWA